MAVDTPRDWLGAHITPANEEQERSQVEKLAHQVPHLSGQQVRLAYVDRGYTGDAPHQAAPT